ncbi:tRNA(Ile)-lysidine synthetase [Lactobacillus selangorensis]|uniref:tRNA(Ile)-lysidine synthase n=1 Tax=Lactobacillus selangorensis TaxID=81857 RepID=A0A0R2G0Y1_9LACO|nr:tRNA lysidine(34) synthetase TilS [Lactobacillus selangorensis]KRN27869.1 tRNA(Ile)-lysidine synthetase [Lactobacillus selangorensis]KRN30660.1 tRNA(Ile)-lysidine synthetase [Lactobacillus selangorensis]
MALYQRFRQHILTTGLIVPQAKLLIAVSTGVDSMVLLELLQRIAPELRLHLGVVYVDHQLRAESAVETTYLNNYCDQHRLPFFVKTWPQDQHPQTGTEAAARQFRYAFFKTTLAQQQADAIVTAHHGDDQLETVLMKLARSGDLAEMRGILAKQQFGTGWLLRPLLPFTKAEIRQYAQQHSIQYFEDATNSSLAMTRNRIRHLIVPQLKQENPQVVSHADQFTQDLTELLDVTQRQLQPVVTAMNVTAIANGYQAEWQPLAALAPILQRLTLEQLFRQSDLRPLPTTSQQQEILHLLLNPAKPQGTLTIGAHFVVRKQYQTFEWVRTMTRPQPEPQRFSLQPGQWVGLPDGRQIGLFQQAPVPQADDQQVTVYLAADDLPLQITHRQTGDRLKMDAQHEQKLKKILIDRKIPNGKRQALWVVRTSQTVIWVPEIAVARLFIRPQSGKIPYILLDRR